MIFQPGLSSTTANRPSNAVVQQLAEPDSPMHSDLWYTNQNAFDFSVLLGFGLVG
jgi:hypothetical protein